MGIMRFLLAISVVGTHAGFPFLVGGPRAVQVFYMISGFLISYVLLETVKYPKVWPFYVSRFLRLWPVYAVIALITLGFHILHPQTRFFEYIAAQPAHGQAFLIFTNLTLFFQEYANILVATPQGFGVLRDLYDTTTPLWPGLLVPPGWSLGVEMSFYLVAPFILHRPKLLIGLLLASLALRGVFIAQGFGMNDPWRYRFFPTELAFFILGALAHQISMRWSQWMPNARWDAPLVGLLLIFLLLFPLGNAVLRIHDLAMTVALYGLFLVTLPLLFRFQNAHRWDVVLGELSYPIYICHWFVLIVVRTYWEGYDTQTFRAFHETWNHAALWLVIPLVILVSWGVNATVGVGVERFRARFRAAPQART